VNTNGSRLLPNIKKILDKNIKLIVTLSLDGVGNVHDYVRWPITWKNYTSIVAQYVELKEQYSNLTLEAWTTVHSLNVENFDAIVDYANQMHLNHDWAFLNTPRPLNPIYTNAFTVNAKNNLKDTNVALKIATHENNQQKLDSFIAKQDSIRNINIKDYI
jgi:sulfatase maturation enzyme AslB (radical SAM superfamily)